MILALKLDYLAKIVTDVGFNGVNLPTQIGIEDRMIRHFAKLFERELANDGANGRLYLESLAESYSMTLLLAARAAPDPA